MPYRRISITIVVVALVGALLSTLLPLTSAASRERDTRRPVSSTEEVSRGKDRSGAKERKSGKERSGDTPVSSGEEVVSDEPRAGTREVTSVQEVTNRNERSGGGDTYIIVLDQEPTGGRGRANGRGAAVREVARELGQTHGLGVEQVYDAALAGFAATVPNEAALQRLKQDPRVKSVEPDRRLAAFDDFPLGVDRVGADSVSENVLPTQPARSGAPVAVLDTGIDASHDDLAGVVQGGIDCTTPGGDSTRFGIDIEGHGTHIAGTISALNNGIGVVGVAPGTPLYDVKVLGDDRGGQTSWTICGLDWVAKNAATLGIKVVNMSLGGQAVAADHNACGATTTALHNAICAVTATGVRITAAAGNSSIDANTIVPATYNEVTTVSALVDSDGCTGGKGRTLNAGADDTRANFSNTGQDVDISAPGARVNSTAPGDGYDIRSGTSMATPHVTAAIALGWSGAEESRKKVPEGILKLSANIGC
jgi:subtilisin